ncbi:MAG TPA: hypothetical protein VEP50_16735, partial [bacterium]|nr:hypothetical protein [bacterium]
MTAPSTLAGTPRDTRAGERDTRGLALAAACLAVFTVELDATVVSLAVPRPGGGREEPCPPC